MHFLMVDEEGGEGMSERTKGPPAATPAGYGVPRYVPPVDNLVAGPSGPAHQAVEGPNGPSSLPLSVSGPNGPGSSTTTEPDGSVSMTISGPNGPEPHPEGDWEFIPDTLTVLHRPGVCPTVCDPLCGHLTDVHTTHPWPQDYARTVNARDDYILHTLRPRADQHAREMFAAAETQLRTQLEERLQEALQRVTVAEAARIEAERLAEDSRTEMARDVARWATKAADTGNNNRKIREDIEAGNRRIRELRRNVEDLDGQQRDTRRELEEVRAANVALRCDVEDRDREVIRLQDECQRIQEDLQWHRDQANPYTREADSDEDDAISNSSSAQERARKNAQVKKSFKDAVTLGKAKASSSSTPAAKAADSAGPSREGNPSGATSSTKKKNKKKGKGTAKADPDTGDKRKRPDSRGEDYVGPPTRSMVTTSTNFETCRLVTAHDAWLLMNAWDSYQNASARRRLNQVDYDHHGRDVGDASPAVRFITTHWRTLLNERFMPVEPPETNPPVVDSPPEKRVRTDSSQPQAGPSLQPGPSIHGRITPPWARNPSVGWRRGMWQPRGNPDFPPEQPPPRLRGYPRSSRGAQYPSMGRGTGRGQYYDDYPIGPSYYNETFGPSGPWQDLPPDDDYSGPPSRGRIGGANYRPPCNQPLPPPSSYDNPDEWIYFWWITNQELPIGVRRDSTGCAVRADVIIHLLVHQLGPDRDRYPNTREGREMWRADLGQFTQEVVGILSIPGLLELTWEEFGHGQDLYAGTRLPHFIYGVPITRETVARQLRSGVQAGSIAEMEQWARRRRNVMARRDEEDVTAWPADSAPSHYDRELLLRVQTTVNRNRSTQPTREGGLSSSSVSASGAPTQRRSPTPKPDQDSKMDD